MPTTPHCATCQRPLAGDACPVCGSAEEWWVGATLPPQPVVPQPVYTPPPPPLPRRRREASPIPRWGVGFALVGLLAAVIAIVATLPPRTPGPPRPADPDDIRPVEPPTPPPPDEPVVTLLPYPQGQLLDEPTSTPLPKAPIERDPPRPVTPVETPRRVDGPILVERHRLTYVDTLAKTLESVPEVSLYRAFTRAEARRQTFAAVNDRSINVLLPTYLIAKLEGLPFVVKEPSKLSPADGAALDAGSAALAEHLRRAKVGPAFADTAEARPDVGPLIEALQKDPAKKWLKPQAVGALTQRLMAEHPGYREVMIGQLALIPGSRATAAIARRAVFDLHPGVRELAVRTLNDREPAEYVPTLLESMSHPWPAAADHAAEALAALRRTEAVPGLLALLDRPDPTLPFEKPGKGPHVRELVAVNHLRGCLICHAMSIDSADAPRAAVPMTDVELSPTGKYAGPEGAFVRADVTYLHTDLSLSTVVKGGDRWPVVQRLDYLVRERPATPAEVARRPPLGATPHQEAVLFALRKLTGKDLGPTVNDWRRQFLGRELPVRSWYTGFKAARALAVDGKGRAFVADTGVLLRKEAAGRPVLVTKDGAGVAGLAIDGKGGLLMACGRTRQVVRLDLTTKEEKRLGDGRTRLAGPRRLAADAEGGVYVTDGSADGRDGGVYYLSASGRVSPLTVAVPQPRGIALSADGRTLYVAAAGALEVWAYPVEGAGLIGSGRRLVKLAGDGGIPDLAVDRRGLIFALNPAARTVEVLRPDGVRVAIARLTESPVGCALDGSSLHVLTKSGLFTVEITPAGTP